MIIKGPYETKSPEEFVTRHVVWYIKNEISKRTRRKVKTPQTATKMLAGYFLLYNGTCIIS